MVLVILLACQLNVIPLFARIITVADVYDALRTQRQYKESISHIETTKIIIQEACIKFDPELMIVFKHIESNFENISNINT